MAGNSLEMTVAKLNHRTREDLHVADASRPIWQVSIFFSPSYASCHRWQFDKSDDLYDFCKTSDQFAAITVYL